MNLSNTYFRQFTRLLAKVDRIDPYATERIIHYMNTQEIESFKISNYVSGLFIWGDTKEGHNYWARISSKIDDEP